MQKFARLDGLQRNDRGRGGVWLPRRNYTVRILFVSVSSVQIFLEIYSPVKPKIFPFCRCSCLIVETMGVVFFPRRKHEERRPVNCSTLLISVRELFTPERFRNAKNGNEVTDEEKNARN